MATPVNRLSRPVSILTIANTTIGMKALMAISGLLWVGFLVFHMYGNLKVFTGAEHFNEYAEGLRNIGAPIFGHLHLLTVARAGLVAAIAIHIWAMLMLNQRNMSSRSQSYAVHTKVQANSAALTMRYGGVAIFFFVVYHLMHFTWGTPVIHPDFVRGDAYHNLVVGFQRPLNVLIYFVALAAVGMHLYHGTWSVFQTLGVNSKRMTPAIRIASLGLALLIPLGFASVPISIMLGLVKL